MIEFSLNFCHTVPIIRLFNSSIMFNSLEEFNDRGSKSRVL